MRILVRCAVLAFVALALAACPRPGHGRKVLEPPHTGDAQARSRFMDARAKFEHDGRPTDAFKRIVDEFPDDPIVPWAALYDGVNDIRARKFDEAGKSLTGVLDSKNEGLALRARLYLGITKNYQGDAAGALQLLAGTEKAIEDDTDRAEYLAAMAYATATAGDPPIRSLGYFDQLYAFPKVTPVEKAAIVARIEEVIAGADPNLVKRAVDELDHKGPSFAIAASRAAILADQVGDVAGGRALREMAGPARVALGLPRTITAESAAPPSSGQAGLIGAVMPLGGKSNRLAEAASLGLGLAAGVGDGKAVAIVEVRAATDGDTAGLAVEDLAKANVVAIVGPIDKDAVEAAAPRADGLGVPLLSLTARPEKFALMKHVFHLMHSGEARSRVLARRALDKGIKKFALLGPDSGFGKTMFTAFTEEVEKGGGSIVTTVKYKEGTKSFNDVVGKLTGTWDAIFVADNSDALELIAPALDAGGLKPRPVGTKLKKADGGRAVLLLSIADGLGGKFLQAAGAHAEGALFAPGYYPDDQDPLGKPFLDRFIVAYGRAPGVLEAYAYDAAQLVAAAGAGGRAGLSAMLAKSELPGLTGTIRFDADHRRADPGVVYTVVEESGAFAIRVAH